VVIHSESVVSSPAVAAFCVCPTAVIVLGLGVGGVVAFAEVKINF